MLLTRFATQIYQWIDRHHGRQPEMIRVPKPVFDQLVEDMDEWLLQHGQKKVECPSGECTILGVRVVSDEHLLLGTFVEQVPASQRAPGAFVVEGKLFFKFKDGLSLSCQCIGEPYASRIVELFNTREK